MYRFAIEELKKWKDSQNRKPLIIEGARQTGKTWLMKEFGQKYYSNCVYVNFDANEKMKGLFSSSLNIKRLIAGLSLATGQKINSADTLIIFDEVQEVPQALTSLKYFYEEAPEYHIICAGSLLGISLHSGTGFPVGKVDFLKLQPMNFAEFLIATGKDNYYELIRKKDFELITAFKDPLIEALKEYYIVGGMPEVVFSFSNDGDFEKVRQIQHSILDSYEHDFSKHAPYELVPKIRMVWNSIISQLAKENRKFVYGVVKEGARAKDFEAAIMWLEDSGLVRKISRVNSGYIPLVAYEDLKAYKLYYLDVGLLSCKAGIDAKILLEGDKTFTEFKGALTEQYVCQQLSELKNTGIYYYTNERSSCEVDFVIENKSEVIPIEVKASENLKAKSLKIFHEKYNIKKSLRISLTNFRQEEWLLNLPLYAIFSLLTN